MDRPDAPPGPVRIVIAASTRDIDRLLAALAGTEALVGAALLAATTIALGISVREGLKPVESLAQQVMSIEPSDLSARLAIPGRPVELAPIVSRLNELLLRVDQAFSREKSFTSNAAHELRTPIAEIRTIAEVAAGADDEERRRSLSEIAEISCEMQETISTLLLMARAKAGTLGVERQEMNFSALLEECCDRREEEAAGRLERTIEPDLTLRGDASILALIIGNLIDNALTYATAGTPIGVRAFREAGQTRVEIENRSEGLTESDMIRLFEPFWRSRAATVTGTHSGLGLALVKALTEAVGGDVGASLDGSGSLRMSLRIPPGSGI
jgi:two-component system sensor histidine kinase QseC